MVKIALGIDLGTTNSCVAVYQNQNVEILQNEYHTYVTPSWVGFTENGIITGHEAKNEAYKNIKNTIFGKYIFILIFAVSSDATLK